MKGFPMRFLVYWGILADKATNKDIKKIVHKEAFISKDWHEMLPSALHKYHTLSAYINRGNPPPSLNERHGYRTSVRTSTGATPLPSLSIQHEGHVPPQRSRSYQWRVFLNSYIERMKQAFKKKIRPCEFQADLMLKRTLSYPIF